MKVYELVERLVKVDPRKTVVFETVEKPYETLPVLLEVNDLNGTSNVELVFAE